MAISLSNIKKSSGISRPGKGWGEEILPAKELIVAEV